MADFWSWQTKTLYTDFNGSKAQVAHSANQVVFVDGRDGNKAKRIMITPEDVAVDAATANYSSDIGINGSYYMPTIVNVVHNKNKDSEYTGEPMGVCFGYCYTQINEFGEESYPSPVKMVSCLQWQKRGSIDADGNYVYDSELRGSLQSVSVRCRISDVNTRGINLYRMTSYATESMRPATLMRLVKGVAVNKAVSADALTEAKYVDIIDSYVTSPVEVDYDNQIGSSGDDIALSGGTVFIANAVKQYAYPVEIASIHKITLTNPNDRNYVNQWFMIDLYDDEICPTGEPSLEGYDWDNFDVDRTRIFDQDFITPIKAKAYPKNQEILDCNGDTIKTRMNVLIQVPYISASGTRDLYFVVSTEDIPTGFGEEIEISEDGASAAGAREILRTNNPVRSDKTLLAYSSDAYPSVNIFDGGNGLDANFAKTNKANSYYGDNPAVGSTHRVNQYDEFANYDGDSVAGDKTGYTYTEQLLATRATIAMPESGYMAGYFVVGAVHKASFYDVMLIKEGSAGNPTITVYVKPYVDGSDKHIAIYAQALTDGETPLNTDDIDFISTGDFHKIYIVVSWRNNKEPVAEDSTIDISVSAMLMSGDGQPFQALEEHKESNAETGYYIDGTPEAYIYFKVDTDPVIQYAMPLVEADEYITGAKAINVLRQLCRSLPYFPVDSIGIDYSTVAIDTDDYYHNANVNIDVVYRLADERPGNIVWSKYSGMSFLNSKNLHDDILRIYPMRSFAPTIEHNTLLVWTRNTFGRVILSGENGESCDYVVDFDDIGLDSRDALVPISGGVAWHDGNEMYIYDRKLRRVSYNRIEVLTGDSLVYDFNNNCLWLIRDASTAYVYDINADNWFKFRYTGSRKVPDAFYLHKNLTTLQIDYCFLSREDYSFYTYSGTAMTTKIKTKAFRIGRNSKIKRWTLLGLTFLTTTLFTYIVNLWSVFMANGTRATGTFTGTLNKKTSVPNIKGEYVQFEIDNADNVSGIEMEVE